MSVLTEGDIVTLVSGSPRMAVEGFEGKKINVVWINEGTVHRDTFNVSLLRKFEASDDRGGFKGGDRGNFKGGDRKGGGKPFGDKKGRSFDDRKDKPFYRKD